MVSPSLKHIDRILIGQMDIQYLTGLKKFFTVYMDMVKSTEPAVLATPKLASLMHTSLGRLHLHLKSLVQDACTSSPQPSKRRGVTKASKMAPCGRPPKRPLTDGDINVQTKRGRPDHVKRKQNLRSNEVQNQANHHKHGRGH